ncbi:MAG TPA: hypothetical protein VNJ51_12285 [Candidatus Dormibacteraeota bacterium]|nr:hypothetical protein [Candidatus Dormibacteraeota bacterium]
MMKLRGVLLTGVLIVTTAAGALGASAADRDRLVAHAVVRYALDVQHYQLIPAVDHVVVVGAYALADWESGETDGESLVKRSASGWRVVAAVPQAFTERALVRRGVPASVARRLIDRIGTMERGQTAAG